MANEKATSLFRKRWRKFTKLKRGYYAFWIMVIAYTLSWCCPVLFNNRPVVVRWKMETNGKEETHWAFPAFSAYKDFPTFRPSGYYPKKMFGLPGEEEPDWKQLRAYFKDKNNGSWMIMPPYIYHPNTNLGKELGNKNPPTHPDNIHWLGTEGSGRDILARIAYGFNISLTFALLVTIVAYIIGIIIGATMGFYGGKVDILGQRLVEIWSSMPFIYVAMILAKLIEPSFFLLVFILLIFGWINISYYIRAEFYREKSKDYVAAAIAQGESNMSIMFRHILPNALTPVITFAPFTIVAEISALVTLDFLKLGLQPPTPSWGQLLHQGREMLSNWWLTLFPLCAIFLTLLLITFIGEALREAFDPKVYSRLR